MRMWKKSRN